jgi:hypothetical protein
LIARHRLPNPAAVCNLLKQRKEFTQGRVLDKQTVSLALPIQVRLHKDRPLLLHYLLDSYPELVLQHESIMDILDKLITVTPLKTSNPSKLNKYLIQLDTNERRLFYRCRLLSKIVEVAFFNQESLGRRKYAHFAQMLCDEITGRDPGNVKERIRRMQMLRTTLCLFDEATCCDEFGVWSAVSYSSCNIPRLLEQILSDEKDTGHVWGMERVGTWTPVWLLFCCLSQILSSEQTAQTSPESSTFKSQPQHLASPILNALSGSSGPLDSPSNPFKFVQKMSDITSAVPLPIPLPGLHLPSILGSSSTSDKQGQVSSSVRLFLSYALYLCPEDMIGEVLKFSRKSIEE